LTKHPDGSRRAVWGTESFPAGNEGKPEFAIEANPGIRKPSLLGRLRRALLKLARRFVYSYDAVRMYGMSAGTRGAEVRLPLIPAVLTELRMHDLRQVAVRNPELASVEWRDDNSRRFADGHRCWGLVNSGHVVSLIWCATAGVVSITEVGGSIAVDADMVYFYAAYTFGRYRGVGFYPYLLQRLCEMFSDKRKVIGARVDNRPSIRGIEKAGFQADRICSRRRILGISFRSQTELF